MSLPGKYDNKLGASSSLTTHHEGHSASLLLDEKSEDKPSSACYTSLSEEKTLLDWLRKLEALVWPLLFFSLVLNFPAHICEGKRGVDILRQDLSPALESAMQKGPKNRSQ